MSRWLSTPKAARNAERRRKEKRRIWRLLAGLAVVWVGLADYFWLRSVARAHSKCV